LTRNGLPFWIDAIIEFGASERVTPMLTAAFGLMAADDGGLSTEEFLRYPGLAAWRDSVLDRLAGFERERDAIFSDLMVDAICELSPVKAGLTCGYFFAAMNADSPELSGIFKSAVLRGVKTAFDTGT